MIPENIKAAVSTLDETDLPGTLADGIECVGAAFHSPTPLVLNSYALSTGDVVWLCPTCSANLTIFERLVKASLSELPWPLRREFGNKIRALAQRTRENSNG